MRNNVNDDPDSGHPTPRDFNPDEATTSTPLPSSRRSSSIRHDSTESFSPRSLFVSPRLPNSRADNYAIVNDVIEMARRKKQLEEENDMMRNQSMMSAYELDESKARIAELEEQMREWDDSKARVSDYQEQAGFLTDDGPIVDLRTAEMKEMEEKWMEERRLLEKEKEEVEEKLREELNIEKKKVEQLTDWQLKCEMVETENGLIGKRNAIAMEKKDAMLKEKEMEIEELKMKLGEMGRQSIASDGSLRSLERDLNSMKNAIARQESDEALDESAVEIKVIDGMKRRNEELEGQLEEYQKKVEEMNEKMEEEKKKWSEELESEKDRIMKRAMEIVERNDALLKEKEEEMKEEMRRREIEVEEMMEEVKRKEKGMGDKNDEMAELRRKLEEKEFIVDEVTIEKEEMERVIEKNMKEIEELRERIGEMESGVGEEVEEMHAIVNSLQNVKTLRDKELAEVLSLKTTIHEQNTTIENLRRLNGELEEMKNENVKMKEELNEKIEEGKISEKGMKELTEKVGEMEVRMDEEALKFRAIEQKNKDLEMKITVADKSLIETTTHYENLKAIREKEISEILSLKTTIHEQNSTIENLRRMNGELEQTKNASLKIKEELNETIEEGKKIASEMDQLKADVERRTHLQKRLEDELDISRKMTEDANDEMKRMKKENEKEREKRQKEWTDEELKNSEELKKMLEKEREESAQRVSDALTEVKKFQELCEELNQQFQEFKASAEHQYATEMAEKDEELSAVRERLAELENYPGRVVSVDGRDSEGRSVYDLLPDQLKDFFDQTTNESVRRAVEFCKGMTIRGEVDSSAPSHLPFFIERLQEIELRTTTFNEFRDFMVQLFKKLVQGEESEEMVEPLAEWVSRLDDEMAYLKEECMKLETIGKKNEKNLRIWEEEKRRMEYEMIGADEERKKVINEIRELQIDYKRIEVDRDAYEKSAVGFKELFEAKVAELEEADDVLEQYKEKCHQLSDELDEKKRKIERQDEEYIEVEKKLEDQIDRYSSISRKLSDETSEARSLEKDKRKLKKELERTKSTKLKLIALIREFMDCLRKHFEVYKRVKGRNEKRQELLDRALEGIEKTRLEMENVNVRRFGILQILEKSIRDDLVDFLYADNVDYNESDRLKKQMQSLKNESTAITDENKENKN